MTPVEILDTCSLLNLYATEKLDQIALSRLGTFAIAEKVKGEALWIRQGRTGDAARQRIAVDLQPFISSGILTVLRMDSTAEEELFLHFAGDLNLDDGEAATCAVAVVRGSVVITDERKTAYVLHEHYPTVRCLSSLDIVKEWANHAGIADPALKIVLLDISIKANYRPYNNHPLYKWWNSIVSA